MILTELHPEEAQALKQEFFKDKRVAVHQLDGYQALKHFAAGRAPWFSALRSSL
jgi:23S rRNA (adenine2030-N6)-methyltransferase